MKEEKKKVDALKRWIDKMKAARIVLDQVEKDMDACSYFHASHRAPFRFSSPMITTAFNQLREARMFAGDILRLTGVENPYSASYDRGTPVKLEKSAVVYDGEIGKTFEAATGEVDVLRIHRQILRELILELIELRNTVLPYVVYGVNTQNAMKWSGEVHLWFDEAIVCTKKACQYLGLRYAEIAAEAEAVGAPNEGGGSK